MAALWCWSFARVAHVELPGLAPALLAVGTWLVYVADRILDGLNATQMERMRERHFFYSQHRMTFLAAGTIISPAFAWLVFTRMSPAARFEDSALFVLAALYFILVHVRGGAARRRFPKELAVGVLFAAATAVPAWARASDQRFGLAPVVAIFSILCWLNCVAIDSWESFPSNLSHPTTVWAAQHLQRLAIATTVFSIVLACASLHDQPRFCLLLASAISALLLIWLANRKRYMAPLQLRIAADAALLTPLLFVAWIR